MFLNIQSENINSLTAYFTAHYTNYYNQITELDCSNNRLTSLEGCPPNLRKLFCSYNDLENLRGCPQNLQQLYCDNNRLTSLVGCPSNLKILHCNNNQLQTLEGCPVKLKIIAYWDNPLEKDWQMNTQEIFLKLQAQRFLQGIQIVNRVTDYKWRFIKKFCEIMLEKWYVPNEDGYAPYAAWSYKQFIMELGGKSTV